MSLSLSLSLSLGELRERERETESTYHVFEPDECLNSPVGKSLTLRERGKEEGGRERGRERDKEELRGTGSLLDERDELACGETRRMDERRFSLSLSLSFTLSTLSLSLSL